MDIANEVMSMLVRFGGESSLLGAERRTPLLGLIGGEPACRAAQRLEQRFGLPTGSISIGTASTLGGLVDHVFDHLAGNGRCRPPPPAGELP